MSTPDPYGDSWWPPEGVPSDLAIVLGATVLFGVTYLTLRWLLP